MREMLSVEKLHELCDAATKKSPEDTKTILSLLIETLHQSPEKFIPQFFIKIKNSRIFPGTNSLFLLAKLLNKTPDENDKIMSEKITAIFEIIIEKCEPILLLNYIFEQYPAISGSNPAILNLIVNAVETHPILYQRILCKLFDFLGQLEKGQCNALMLTNIALAQICLQKYLKIYIETIHDLDVLIAITDEKTLLSTLIDYHADAISSFEIYSVRGFVKRHIERESAHRTLRQL